jgi:hypothetical protein
MSAPDRERGRVERGSCPSHQAPRGPQVGQPREASLIAERLHGLSKPGRLQSGRAWSIVKRLAPQGILGGELQVQPEFVLQIGITGASAGACPRTAVAIRAPWPSLPRCSALLRQQGLHHRHHAIPLGFLGHQLTSPGRGDLIEAGLPIVVRPPQTPRTYPRCSRRIRPGYSVPMFRRMRPAETCSSRAAIA